MKEYTGKTGDKKLSVTELLMVGPDLFHLAICLLGDPEVPVRQKLKLGAAVTYFVSPLDFLPELLLGPLGYIDDIAILAWVLNSMLNQIHPDVILRYWAGDASVLSTVQRIVEISDRTMGKGLFRKIKSSVFRSIKSD